jgi:hypothetical protein
MTTERGDQNHNEETNEIFSPFSIINQHIFSIQIEHTVKEDIDMQKVLENTLFLCR